MTSDPPTILRFLACVAMMSSFAFAADDATTAGPVDGAPIAAQASAPTAKTAHHLPDGFLDVVLGSKVDDVKRALPRDSQLREVEDRRGCPLPGDHKCRRIIESVPRDLDKPYKKAEYLFNPFTMRLVRIDVDYRLDKVDLLSLRDQFVSSWGPPTDAREEPVAKEAFWPEGIERTEVWTDAPIEVRLVYRTYPSRPDLAPLGAVHFVHLDEERTLEQLGESLRGMSPAGASGESDEGTEPDEDAAERLF